MPKISFNFHGSFDALDVQIAIDTNTNKIVDVSKLSQEDLIKALKNGNLSISIYDSLMDGHYDYLELTDFTCPLANIPE